MTGGCVAEYTHVQATSPGPTPGTTVAPRGTDDCVEAMLPAELRKEHARRAFKRGMESIAAGNVADGIRALKRAYCTLPHPHVAFNIAHAHGELHEWSEAIVWYRRYLASHPPDAYDVELAIERLERDRCISSKQKSGLAIEKAALADECTSTSHPSPPPELH